MSKLRQLGNYHIPVPGGQTLSPPALGVIPCEYVGVPHITKNYRYIVLPSCEDGIILHSFVFDTIPACDGQTE